MTSRRPATERRKWARLPLAVPVFVRSVDENGKEALEFATAMNIGGGGALVVVRRSPLPLSTVVLEIPSAPLAAGSKLPQFARCLRAKTVRITHGEGYHLLAVKFSRPLIPEQVRARARKVPSNM